MDIVGCMTTINDATIKLALVDPASDKYVAQKTAPAQGRYIEPDSFTKIVHGVRGDAEYAWITAAPVLAS